MLCELCLSTGVTDNVFLETRKIDRKNQKHVKRTRGEKVSMYRLNNTFTLYNVSSYIILKHTVFFVYLKPDQRMKICFYVKA